MFLEYHMMDKVQKPSNPKVSMFWRNLQPLSSDFSQMIPIYHTTHGLTSQERVIFFVLPVSYRFKSSKSYGHMNAPVFTKNDPVTILSQLMCFTMGSSALQTNVFSLRIVGVSDVSQHSPDLG
jgi:hypothetical protein